MRMKLHLKRLQLRLRQSRFQLRSFHFVLAIFAVIIESVKNANNRGVHQQVLLQRHRRDLAWRKSEHAPEHHKLEQHFHQRKENAGKKMNGEAAHALIALDRKPAGKRKNQRRQNSPRIPIRHCHRKSLSPRWRRIGVISVTNVDLAGGKEPQKCPAREEQAPSQEASCHSFAVLHWPSFYAATMPKVHFDKFNKMHRQKQWLLFGRHVEFRLLNRNVVLHLVKLIGPAKV